MRTTRVIVTVALLLVGAGAASAEVPGRGDRFMEGLKGSVYASEHHMAFSLRSSVIRWLGGVPVARASDVSVSRQEHWWGRAVPVLRGPEAASAAEGSIPSGASLPAR